MDRRRLDPVLAGLGAFSVAILLWFLAGPGGATTSWAVQAGLDLLIAVFSGRMAAATRGDRYARRFWRAVVGAASLCALGDGYQTVLTILHGATHRPSGVQTAFVVIGMIIVMVTMVFHPLGGTGRMRLRLWLDAATVLCGVIVFLWYFVLAEVVEAGDAAALTAAVAPSAVMLLITVGLLKWLLSGTAPFGRGPGIVASLGVAGTAIASSTVTLVTGTEDPGVLYAAQLVPCLLMPVSMRMQERQVRRGGPGRTADRRRSSRLPYLAVGAVQLLLVAGLAAHHADLRLWGVTVGAVLITALVVGRQMAALTDNERLLGEIADSREWFRSLVQHSSDATLAVGRDGTVLFATPAVSRVLGLASPDVDATTLAERLHPEDVPPLRDLRSRLAAHPGVEAAAQVRLRHADGSYRWLQVVGVDLTDNPSVRATVFNARDVTEARALHDTLLHQATHDTLTGLADRGLLEQRLDRARTEAAEVSVLLIDLDGFKPVNDRYGHHAGDLVLIAVAERLARRTGDDGLAVRLGGDEFAVLLSGGDPATADEQARLIARELAEPIVLPDGLEVTIGASVGVATGVPYDGAQLLKDADAAMYRRKAVRSGTAR